MSAGLPPGYVRVAAGRYTVVSLVEHERDARALLAEGSLYEAAARDLGARALSGRGIAYEIALPASGVHAVVRHNRHGGLLAPVTRDLFLPPTRAPRELATALRLSAAGISTPKVLMYGVARHAFLLRRADVMTLAVEDASDLATFMLPGTDPARRAEAWRATHALVHGLDQAGAWHQDLNVKNVLLAPRNGALQAWVLDVDRVVFTDAATAHRRNRERLLRSARKWRDERGAEFTEPADY